MCITLRYKNTFKELFFYRINFLSFDSSLKNFLLNHPEKMQPLFYIVAKHSRKVLDVEGAAITNGARIIQFTKKAGDDPTVGCKFYISHCFLSINLMLTSI